MAMISRFAVALTAALALSGAAHAGSPAPTPPMGWNSWDAYGFTIDEDGFKADAKVLAGIKQYGWQYTVIDEGWYMGNPDGDKLAARAYQLDANGRLIPDSKRYASAADGAGFKQLADWVHAQGLKFGLHIVRGIPKQAVADNDPIADSTFHAADAADTTDLCGWDDGDYGVKNNAAGQAYYNSVMKLYADWGVDFVKVDCIADHPFKPTEIRQIARAIKKTGRPMVLSLSPGPTQLANARFVSRYSQMWRISNDIWDGWTFRDNGREDSFPKGIVSAFDNLVMWNAYAGPGHWPDADMLPFGSLTPHPGWGDPRDSRLTHDEERTQFTLWAIARSPLILGANLTKLDDFTRSLITNKDVIAVNQTAWASQPVTNLPSGFDHIRVWKAQAGPKSKPVTYVAIFNLDDQPATVHASWKEVGLHGDAHASQELWSGASNASSDGLDITLPAHGCAIYRVE